MTNNRLIAADAAFMVLYIGLTAAMVALSFWLLGLLAIGAELGGAIVVAAAVNVLGWVTLPFAPRVYAKLVGHPFRWRENVVLGGSFEG